MSDPQFERLLHDLEMARRSARARAAAALTGDAPSTASLATPLTASRTVPLTTPLTASETVPLTTPPTASQTVPLTTPPTSPGGPGLDAAPPEARSSVAARAAAVARAVAALVVTAAVVLGGWLLVLEPALGSRPVVVRDELMSPSLRTGDVALAVAPDGPLGAGAIVAVRMDGRTVVTRVIGREEVQSDAPAEVRAAAGLAVRADGEPLEVSAVVALDDVVGEIGAAVPRVGLLVVLASDPTGSPAGTAVLVVVAAVTAIGLRGLARERRGPTQ